MANILLTYAVPEINNQCLDIGFYEGLIKSLADCGNNVMRVFTNKLTRKPWAGDNKFNSIIKRDLLLEDIKNFNPDLIISFNFSSFEGLDKLFDCPFLVMEADLFHYYNNLAYLKEHQDRFTFINTNEKSLQDTIKGLGLSPQVKAHIINYGTTVQSGQDNQYNTNVSFIGSLFSTPISALIRFENFTGENFYSTLDQAELLSVESSRIRIKVLDEMTDLGLKLYGANDWKNLAPYFLKLADSYRNEVVYSVADYERIYNGSKICLNISHKQAIDAFPWRIMDIMASNGCLITNKSSGIDSFTKGYVTIPSYETAGEAKSLAQKLLNDKVWREDIVKASHLCIKDKGRWPDAFKLLQDITGCSILNPNEKGSIVLVDNEKYFTETYRIISKAQEILVPLVPVSLYKPAYDLLNYMNIPVSQQAALKARARKR